MLMDFFRGLFGRRHRLPIDRVSRAPRAAKKAAKAEIDGMQAALAELGAIDGIADIATRKRVPKGTDATWRAVLEHYDRYLKIVRDHLGLGDAVRPGTPEGRRCCEVAPFGVSGLESLVIFRTIRLWPDFPAVAQGLAEAGERLIKDIQERHQGADPEKIRMTSPSVTEGRLAHARRGIPCPLLDPERGRCRVWEVRPLACRGHLITGDPAQADPSRDDYLELPAKNFRLPIHPQVAHVQLEKRLLLQLTPFLYPNLLILLQLAEGQTIAEDGEPPLRFGGDGVAIAPANRSKGRSAKGKGRSKERGKRR